MLEELKALGFRDNEALLEYECCLPNMRSFVLPRGFNRYVDGLEETNEDLLFLERFNRVFNEHISLRRFQNNVINRGLVRIVLADERGFAGECCFVPENGCANIIWLYVEPPLRRRGLGRCLLLAACQEAYRREMDVIRLEIHSAIPGVQRLLQTVNFKRTRVVYRYPGMDFEP